MIITRLDQNHFNKAIHIISKGVNSQITINGLPDDNVRDSIEHNLYTIYIHKCTPLVIRNLVDENFQLEMTDRGLEVWWRSEDSKKDTPLEVIEELPEESKE